MADNDRLTVKQEVSLRWATEETAVTSRALVANVLRERVWLDVPPGEGAALELQPGQPLRLSLHDLKEKRRDTYWAADVRFVEVIRERPPRISVERPFRFVPVQRRAFFRLKIAVPFVLLLTDEGELATPDRGHHAAVVPEAADTEGQVAHAIDASEAGVPGVATETGPTSRAAPAGDEAPAVDSAGSPDEARAADGGIVGEAAPDRPATSATTEDLSGGGLRFATTLDLAVHQRVEIRLGCPPGYWIPIGAEVVRVVPVVEDRRLRLPGTPDRRSVALTFVRIHARDQDRVVAYLFAMERRGRREA